jgi:hypothetical protein
MSALLAASPLPTGKLPVEFCGLERLFDSKAAAFSYNNLGLIWICRQDCREYEEELELFQRAASWMERPGGQAAGVHLD